MIVEMIEEDSIGIAEMTEAMIVIGGTIEEVMTEVVQTGEIMTEVPTKRDTMTETVEMMVMIVVTTEKKKNVLDTKGETVERSQGRKRLPRRRLRKKLLR